MLLVAVMGTTVKAEGEHWSWNSHEYLANSTFVGVITIEGVEQRSDQLEIGAFCDGVCRGSIICIYNANKDRYYACLTVNGAAGMNMTFRLWNHATEEELNVDSEITYTFQPNDYFGVPSNPYVFPFTLHFEGPVYTGGTSNTWSDPENWRDEEPPTSVDDEVFILNDCNLDEDVTVAAMTIIEGQSLTVDPGSTLVVSGDLTNTMPSGIVIQEGGQIINETEDVSATMQIGISSYNRTGSGGWYTIASPMVGMEIEGSDFLTPDYDLYRFNDTRTEEEWENYKSRSNTDFTIFESGRGYIYANSNTVSPTFSGTLNVADVTRTLTFTRHPEGECGWNLIGNPFPHKIYKGAGGAIDNTNLASGYYTLDNEGTWQVHSFDDAIQPGQGILVKATAPTTLTIAKSTEEALAESGEARRGMRRLCIRVAGDSGHDRAYVYFGEGISLDKFEDMTKEAPSLAIRRADGDFAIAHFDKKSDAVELVFTTPTNGSFTLTVDVASSDFKYLHLIDLATGDDIDLLSALRQAQGPQEPTSYTFTVTKQAGERYFKLFYKLGK